MSYHPRTLVGVALSTSALLLLGLPVAAEEPAPAAPPADDPCAAAPEEAGGADGDETEAPAEETVEDEADAEIDAEAPADTDDGDELADAEPGDGGAEPADAEAESGEDPARVGTVGEPCPAETAAPAPAPAPEAGSTSVPPAPPTPVPAPEPPTHADEHVPPPLEEVSRPETPPLDDLPGDVHELITGYPRTPAGSTADLVEALRPLADYGLTAGEVARVGYGRFPVGGHTTWVHDWLFPRYVPSFHPHMGIDLFADRGTPVRAPAAGTVRTSDGSIGGLAVKVIEPDGTYWYLAHLDSVVHALDGTTVDAGTIVGTVGDSGNARGGLPHVHLQLHPGGGEPVDPKPVIDELAAEALAAAPAVLEAHRPPPGVLRALARAFTWTDGRGDDRDGDDPERDPILDLLLPLARLERAPEGRHGD